MVFNSLIFIIFFLIVYSIYLPLTWRLQNLWLLLASYVFYGWWDWRFLFLLFLSTLFAYYCGLKIADSSENKQKVFFLNFGIIVNVCFLFFFKYFNFFISNFERILNFVGVHVDPVHLNIILPLGISFYTFQKMSYLFDVSRGTIKPVRSLTDFMLFASFFPQLVAGPIERGRHLLPQIQGSRSIKGDNIAEGCYLLLWGYFLKVFVADSLAKIVGPAFDNPASHSGLQVLIAAYAFTFQIYCDFAGYSNMARGLGKLMGFELMYNFNLPFFATNIQEFWRRWHISLTTWIQDYLYFPLFHLMRGVKGNLRIYVTILLTMATIGFWHGASWNFIIFGVYHGVLIIGYLLIRSPWSRFINSLPFRIQPILFWCSVIFMFQIVSLGMVIFRCQSVDQALEIICRLKDMHLNNQFTFFALLKLTVSLLWSISFMMVCEFIQFKRNDPLAILKLNWVCKGVMFFLMIFLLLTFGVGGGKEFIYFQF